MRNLSDLYSRPLEAYEAVLCVDENTNLRPRTRQAKTLPPEPGKPLRVENEYQRKGALHLFAAFDTRSGRVYHTTGERKRQAEFIQIVRAPRPSIASFAYDCSHRARQPADA